MKSDIKNNAHRLAYTLSDMSGNERLVKTMSQLMNYSADQLKEDMEAVNKYIQMLENQTRMHESGDQ